MGCAALASEPGRLLNLSNRAFIGTGDERLIGSVRAVGEPGTQVEVLVVARGPSLADDLPADYTGNVLADPRLTLVELATREETTNDNFADWNDGEIESRFPGFISDAKESGAILRLEAGQAYSAIVEGADGATGLGQVEFYEIDGSGSITEARLGNLSNRALVGLDHERLIGSALTTGESPVEVLVVARGPSLADALPDYTGNVLADPRLTLVDLATRDETTNDNFADWNDGEIESRFPGFISDAKEAGFIVELPAESSYSAILEGVGNERGIGQIEFYELSPTMTYPDLVVSSLSVSNDNPITGESFTLSINVLNQGNGESEPTTLRYYRSHNPTISYIDAEEGTDSVAMLAMSETSVESIELTASSTLRTWYYGACIDAVTEESDTTNNCSESIQVKVKQPPPPPKPNLVVSSTSVSNDALETGESFTLSATVSNTGDGESGRTTLRYYRSTNATITTSDTQVGMDEVGALAASEDSSESIELTAPSTARTWYYGACIDAVTGESDTTNNCSDSVQVVVIRPAMADLVVTSPSVSNDRLKTGESFTLSATVSNAGDGESAATTLRYYRSTDATITASDVEIGTDPVDALAASEESSESIELTAPSTPGGYYYGACVDTVAGESDTFNNCSDSIQVDVIRPPTMPDLVVTSPSVSNDNPATGESFTLSATVNNTGDGESAATTLRYYRSTDGTITTSDTLVGMDEVGALAASGSSAESIELDAPSTPGDYFYGACVDAVAGESDTSNNCSDSVQVDVKERRTTSPGLDIDLVYVDPQPSAAFKAAINAAARVWESAITNDLTDIDFAGDPQDNPCTDVAFDGYVDDLRVYIYFVDIDGPGGTTASAGFCTQRSSSKTPVIGLIRFDSSDVNRLSATTVGHIAEHELAHVLGFGIRWDNLQNPSFQGGQAVDPPPDTHWPGTKAVAAFNAAGGASYQGGKVPVENERGGSGSQDKHWRLSVMPGELMTYNLDGTALSRITLQSMADLGYSVNTSVVDSYTVPSVSQALLSLAVPPEDHLPFYCEIEHLEVDYVQEQVPANFP